MKKGLKVGVIGLGLVGMFGLGGLVGSAGLDWQTEVTNEASKRLAAAAHYKTEELASKDMSEQMMLLLEDDISAQEQELERLLQEYYQMKLDGLEDSAEFAEVSAEIKRIQQIQLDRFRSEIDEMFATQ